MAQTIQFFVDDTSPSVSYSPFGDTFSIADLTAGWNPYFDVSGFVTSLGEVGTGTSYHGTSLNGAALSISWKGTGIQLLGYTTQASYDITIDGTPQTTIGADQHSQILATFQNLSDAEHTLSLSARIPIDQEPPESSGLYFDQALIISAAAAPVNSSFTQQSLNNSAVSFVGQWSFQNESANSFHLSITQGDVARTTFTGASFLLNGKTSPKAGAYSVVLDNTKTSWSGKSSFTKRDSLLFFASGLDPEKTHNVEIINEDGSELAVRSDGFELFAKGPQVPPGPPTPSPSPSPVSASSSGHPKGTIAALVLAGILAFLILAGSLFFFFVIRPRRRRARLNRMARRRRKEQEAGDVLDIGPRPELDFDSGEATPGHGANRYSGRSGFTRWKREVEGGLGSLGIGISFRHSDSTGGRVPGGDDGENEPLSTKSSLFSTSSRPSSKRSKKGKRKAKPKHVSDSSWSPSFALELPVRPPSSVDSYKEKDAGPSHFSDDRHLSLISGMTPLSYMSAPPRTASNLAPPSYSVSSSNRNSNSTAPPQSVPRSVSQSVLSSQTHSRRESSGLLLNYGDPNPGSPDEEPTRSYEPVVSSLAPPLDSRSAREDRGSAKYSSDDTTSYIGSATTRLAIRGLSPRTSEFMAQNLPPEKSERERPERKPKPPPLAPSLPPSRSNIRLDQPIEERSSGQRSAAGTTQTPGSSFLEVRSPVEESTETRRPRKQRSGSATPKVPDSAFLDIRPTSPFEVDFSGDSSQRQGEASGAGEKSDKVKEKASGGGSDGKEVERTDKGERSVQQGERSPEKEKGPRKLRSVFRLTPPSNPPSISHGHARKGSASFLDFSSSSDTSNRTQSVATSQFSGRWPSSSRRQGQSRWSNALTQTTELSRSDSSGGSIPVASPVSPPHSIFSNTFPYPVSLPPSPHHPEGHIHSPTPPILPRIAPEQTDNTTGGGIHPLSPVGSPTDSIPMSVSELRFRHSGSTGESHTSSHLPPHPPLPPLPSRETPSELGTPGLSTPSYIVQHVLGQTSTHSGLDSGRSSNTPRNDHNDP
ncbi:hypothetical protein Hypma_002461 [Hypsizygus marmoreus]|uniref:Uncharacterized protein n=1 Tax=Hypsizygus marmoreus TaxID=39966 RepID=A0A369JDB6_HYPMA|nr:hypothetical protein Hypma_002461 [Hypsizygus marmoreus]